MYWDVACTVQGPEGVSHRPLTHVHSNERRLGDFHKSHQDVYLSTVVSSRKHELNQGLAVLGTKRNRNGTHLLCLLLCDFT